MKKIIIVGAGIAGLAAGVYARQSGFDTVIYESHSIPGGASTSWKRGGYLFEGGMHWLTGSSPKTALNKIWREVGALNDDTAIHVRESFHTVNTEQGDICLYRDVEKLKGHLLEIAPEDEKEIKTLCKDIKRFMNVGMPITDIKGVKVKNKAKAPISTMLSMISALPRMGFYSGMSSDEYAMRYKNPHLRHLFSSIVGGENNAVAILFTLSTLAAGDGGYPVGGSLGMAGRMAEKFISLGGEIKYNMGVEKIIEKDGIATGVLINGEVIQAHGVIVTQDALVAIDTLFAEPIKEPWAEKMRRETKPVLNTFVSVGIKADLSDLPESLGFALDTPIFCGSQKINDLGINNYATYENYAPEGCSAVTSTLMGDTYDWWKEQKELGKYEEEKEKLAQAFIRALTKKYPQIDGKVEVWDVATPLTYERYLHSYKGSWMTFMGKGENPKPYPTKADGLRNVYFAGQRLVAPGGLPTAVETGRKAVQYLCRDTNTVFQGEM